MRGLDRARATLRYGVATRLAAWRPSKNFC